MLKSVALKRGRLSEEERQILLGEIRTSLRGAIRTASPGHAFRLAPDLLSSQQVDMKKVIHSPIPLLCISRVVFEMLRDEPVEAIGGPEIGAVPIAAGVSMLAAILGASLPAFIVRKTAKGHGLRKDVEGTDIKSKRVALVEDVIVTGRTISEAVRVVQQKKARVISVIVLLDWELSESSAIRRTEIPCWPLFRTRDLLSGKAS